MVKKTQKELIYDYITAQGSCSLSDVVEGTGIKTGSASPTLTKLKEDGSIEIDGSAGCYEYRLARPNARAMTNKQRVYDGLLRYGPITVHGLSDKTGLSLRSVKAAISNLDRNDGVIEAASTSNGVRAYKAKPKEVRLTPEQMAKRIVKLGGGPFGLMAAQLGATA